MVIFSFVYFTYFVYLLRLKWSFSVFFCDISLPDLFANQIGTFHVRQLKSTSLQILALNFLFTYL